MSTFFDQITSSKFRITVLGLGHIGLPTALGFAEMGWEVVGADTDANKVCMIKQGKCPFFEPGLQELLLKHLDNPNLTFTVDVDAAVRAGTVIFLCVGTPQRNDGEADLTAIEALARTIAHNLEGYKLIVEKSTVPAITGHWIKKVLQRRAKHASCAWDMDAVGSEGGLSQISAFEFKARPVFDIASNPEFLQEGKAVENFFAPDRIVCGVMSNAARQILKQLYRNMKCPILFTDITTAELIKHSANAFLATKISFINMLSDVCEAVGADVTQVAVGIGLDSRIGPKFLNAGLGFGGYCLPKDLRAFIHLAEEYKVNCGLLRETERVNQDRVTRLIRKIREALWIVDNKTIAVLGLSFKPDTDDLREAPSLRVIEALQALGARLRIYDPQGLAQFQTMVGAEPGVLTLCRDAYDAADQADAIVVLTEWDEFRHLDLERLREQMHTAIMIDGRNIYDPADLERAGFEYQGMGRHTSPGAPLPDSVPKLSLSQMVPEMLPSATGDD